MYDAKKAKVSNGTWFGLRHAMAHGLPQLIWWHTSIILQPTLIGLYVNNYLLNYFSHYSISRTCIIKKKTCHYLIFTKTPLTNSLKTLDHFHYTKLKETSWFEYLGIFSFLYMALLHIEMPFFQLLSNKQCNPTNQTSIHKREKRWHKEMKLSL